LTPELQRQLCSAISAGNYRKPACASVGIDYSTFLRWVQKGKRARRGPFCEFCSAVSKAEAAAEVAAVAAWRKAIPEHPSEYRQFLARRYPVRWGDKGRLELTGRGAGPVLSRKAVETLSDAELHALIDRLLGVPGFAAGRLAGRQAAPPEVPGGDGQPEDTGPPAGPGPVLAGTSCSDLFVDDEPPPYAET
jgi:hypothetical protein